MYISLHVRIFMGFKIWCSWEIEKKNKIKAGTSVFEKSCSTSKNKPVFAI